MRLSVKALTYLMELENEQTISEWLAIIFTQEKLVVRDKSVNDSKSQIPNFKTLFMTVIISMTVKFGIQWLLALLVNL